MTNHGYSGADTIDKVRAWRDEGKSWYHIGRHLGLSEAVIRKFASLHGLPIENEPPLRRTQDLPPQAMLTDFEVRRLEKAIAAFDPLTAAPSAVDPLVSAAIRAVGFTECRTWLGVSATILDAWLYNGHPPTRSRELWEIAGRDFAKNPLITKETSQ